jgi:ABC-2 type transport system permease protein
MPNGSDVVAKTVTAVLCVAGIVPMLMAIGLSLGDVQLSLRSMIAIEALALGGALPFCGLGFLIGVYASARAVPAVVNVVMIPMLYLSGALFPLPQGLSWVSHLTPPFYLQQLMLAAAGSPSQFHPLIHAGVLFGIAVVSTALSLRRFAFVG